MSPPSPLSRLLRRLVGEPAGETLWLSLDRALRLGLGLVVQIMVARHLGPAGSGVLQSGLALAAIIAVGLEMGLDGVLRRELVRHPERAGALLGTATLLRSLMLPPSLILFLWLNRVPEGMPPALSGWLAVTIALPLATSAEVWLLAQSRMRANVLAQGAVIFASAAGRVGLVLAGAGLLAFGVVAALETLLLAISLTCALKRSPDAPLRWSWDGALARRLLADATPLLLTGLAIFIYRRVDLIIVARLLDPVSTGHYGAAIRASELGYVVPMILYNAWFPRLTRLHVQNPAAYPAALADFFRRGTWAALLFAAATTVFAGPLVRLVYGPAFAGAAAPLALHAWTGVFIAHGIARSLWLNLENRQLDGLWLALAGAAANLGLNFLLVPRLGVNGAALAALGALFLNMALLPACFARTRPGWRLGWRATLGLPLASGDTTLSSSPAHKP